MIDGMMGSGTLSSADWWRRSGLECFSAAKDERKLPRESSGVWYNKRMVQILIVDDERVIRDGLKALLAGEGYSVRAVRDGDAALAAIAERRPDLVLLDIMMPRLSGFKTCEAIRRTDKLLPVVFLTAKVAEADMIRAKELGCEDFVSKSASDTFLLTCVRCALTRARAFDAGLSDRESSPIRLGGVSVHPKTLVVTKGDSMISRLTKTEGDILKLLLAARGEPVTKDKLIESLRGQGFACVDTMVYMHVSNLRRKLGPAGAHVVTNRNVGYSLV